jgi:hypothetical protein
MRDELDADTLVVLSALGEIENQCRWGLAELQVVRTRIPKLSLRGTTRRQWDRWFRNRHELFGAIQGFLTAAGIADSLVTGRGPPRPKGLVGISDQQRASIRESLGVSAGFEVGGRPQRNALVHIEERLVAWARPGGMRGDFAILGIDMQKPGALKECLRVFDRTTLQFGVVGEVCRLTKVEASLQQLLAASVSAHQRILAEVNARNRAASPATGANC